MTTEEALTEIAAIVGAPPSDPAKIVTQVRYLSHLVYKFSMPGLIDQAPGKYELDRRHVQELPR